MKKILIIVDPQYDFIDGSLAVNGAKEAMDKTIAYVRNLSSEEYSHILITCDWHPKDHSSFDTWPSHCVQHTHGAEIYNPLMDSVIEKCNFSGIQWAVFEKGRFKEKEEYSFLQDLKNVSRFKIIINLNEIKEVEVCGIAKDFCVKNTINDLLTKKRIGEFSVTAIDNLCPYIEDEHALEEFVESGLEIKNI